MLEESAKLLSLRAERARLWAALAACKELARLDELGGTGAKVMQRRERRIENLAEMIRRKGIAIRLAEDERDKGCSAPDLTPPPVGRHSRAIGTVNQGLRSGALRTKEGYELAAQELIEHVRGRPTRDTGSEKVERDLLADALGELYSRRKESPSDDELVELCRTAIAEGRQLGLQVDEARTLVIHFARELRG